jgi:hypothetical protein
VTANFRQPSIDGLEAKYWSILNIREVDAVVLSASLMPCRRLMREGKGWHTEHRDADCQNSGQTPDRK